ncbi:MAG: hypothetical protein GX666_01025 [Tissierellia bacterium]|nr:hypothetical protein [Tissierellia bacterium]
MNTLNTFYNGKEITKENLLSLIKECIEEGWQDSDLQRNTEIALEKIYHGQYDGVDEDIQFILEELNSKTKWGYLYPNANLQDVEIIIKASEGSWYFQED